MCSARSERLAFPLAQAKLLFYLDNQVHVILEVLFIHGYVLLTIRQNEIWTVSCKGNTTETDNSLPQVVIREGEKNHDSNGNVAKRKVN